MSSFGEKPQICWPVSLSTSSLPRIPGTTITASPVMKSPRNHEWFCHGVAEQNAHPKTQLRLAHDQRRSGHNGDRRHQNVGESTGAIASAMRFMIDDHRPSNHVVHVRIPDGLTLRPWPHVRRDTLAFPAQRRTRSWPWAVPLDLQTG